MKLENVLFRENDVRFKQNLQQDAKYDKCVSQATIEIL